MRRSPYSLDHKFLLHWKDYLLQSFFATAGIFILLLILHLQNAVIVASIGATVFIVFTMPKDVTATPRHVVGGHVVGLVCGLLWALVPQTSPILSLVIYSLAVGCSMFIMVITDTEHPPAAGTALGVVIAGFSMGVAISIVTSVVLLALIHHFCKPYFKDLM